MSLSPNYRLDESAHNPLWGVLLTFPLSYRKILQELYIILGGFYGRKGGRSIELPKVDCALIHPDDN